MYADSTYYASNGGDRFLHWVATNTTTVLAALLAACAVALLIVFSPWLADAAYRLQLALPGAFRSLKLWLVGWAVVAVGYGDETSSGLAIIDRRPPAWADLVTDEQEPVEAGEAAEATGDDPPFDPLTSPLPQVEERTPLHDALAVNVAPPPWATGFTGMWAAVDTAKVPDPGPNYTQWQLGLPIFRELDEAATP